MSKTAIMSKIHAGNRLREALRFLKITQTELANELGLTQGLISKDLTKERLSAHDVVKYKMYFEKHGINMKFFDHESEPMLVNIRTKELTVKEKIRLQQKIIDLYEQIRKKEEEYERIKKENAILKNAIDKLKKY